MVKISKSAKGSILNNMRIVVDIPKEFEDHYRFDKFNDSLNRLRVDAHCLAGRYERELCDMLIEAFNNGITIHKGHGDLIDINNINEITLEDSLHIMSHTKGDEVDWYIDAPVIVKADNEGE